MTQSRKSLSHRLSENHLYRGLRHFLRKTSLYFVGIKNSKYIHLIVAAIITAVILQIDLDYFEAFFFDFRFRISPRPRPSGNIELVQMDQTTVDILKSIPSFKHYDDLAKVLIKEGPLAIVFVTPLSRNGNISSDKALLAGAPDGTNEEAMGLAETLASFPHTYQLTEFLKLRGEPENTFKLAPPLDNVKVLCAYRTVDTTLFAKDSVARRAFVTYQEQPLGAFYLSTFVNLIKNPGSQLKSGPELEVMAKDVKGQFDVYDSRQIYTDYLTPGSFPITKFESVLRLSFPKGRFKNKIVLIGDDFGKSIRNYSATPFSRDPGAMVALETHAHIIDTFIRNSAPIPSPEWVKIFFVFLITFVTIRVVLSEHPLRGLWILGTMLTLFLGFSFFMFRPFGILIPMAHPLISTFLCYYFLIPYRLIVENRRSWEYYQKNQILKQVEELKTNFISMMSHDIKTPIARIQGMTDVITRDVTPLSGSQREAIDHIRASSDDLLKFINTILNYAKIESEGVELHLQGKDINDLLAEVIKKHEFLAKLRHIEIIQELEPMFPIRVDPDLMKQVLSNLVENAIKYSPDNSKVLVTSSEVDGFLRVEVSDQGQGIPPDELPNVFMKFFRSKNAKSSKVKGSGLGLYLAKYFVELHNGKISVTSESGSGSTFTVELPINS